MARTDDAYQIPDLHAICEYRACAHHLSDSVVVYLTTIATTYAYDNNGNLISAGTATTTYTYDVANRLIAIFAGGATTTYGYDAFGARMIQTGTSTTTHRAHVCTAIFPQSSCISKYPPAKPGALLSEPLKAAGRGRYATPVTVASSRNNSRD
jgi:YD repeat-containing protein